MGLREGVSPDGETKGREHGGDGGQSNVDDVVIVFNAEEGGTQYQELGNEDEDGSRNLTLRRHYHASCSEEDSTDETG